MSEAINCVAELARLFGVEGRRGGAFDWDAIEGALRLRLPEGYKALVEIFPDGRFQGVIKLIRPGSQGYSKSDYLGYHVSRLEDMRVWRADGHGNYPYPIYPEPGGLLPWATGPHGELFFWLTSDPDPEKWPIVYSDTPHGKWVEHSGSVCQLIKDLVSAPTVGTPRFEPSSPELPATPPPLRELYWDRMRRERKSARGEFQLLADLLGAPSNRASQVDWNHVEQRLGLRLPSDYKSFIDTYGGGVLCDVVIVAPEPTPSEGLFALLDRKRQDAESGSRNDWSPPVYPEPGGMICWGETLDGWSCGWAPTSVDPDTWGVVVAAPGQHMQHVTYTSDLSFSTYLAKYLTGDRQAAVFIQREPWSGNITFESPGRSK